MLNTCEACGTKYAIGLHKCPHCGALLCDPTTTSPAEAPPSLRPEPEPEVEVEPEAEPEVVPAEVRAWAAENGREVSPRGRIPADVISAYLESR
jgi:predicted  nucleic acid-binding Zn-ribbon protein